MMNDRTRGWTGARRVRCAGSLLLSALVLGGCAWPVVDRGPVPALAQSKADKWAVVPLQNLTETPQAGQRAAMIAQSLLASYGYTNMVRYPATSDDETLFDPAKPDAQRQALDWARDQHVRYALTGAVDEWRYKVGVDGEPAVGLTFEVIDVNSGKIVWSTSGARTGWSRAAVSGVAQKLERQLLAPLH